MHMEVTLFLWLFGFDVMINNTENYKNKAHNSE